MLCRIHKLVLLKSIHKNSTRTMKIANKEYAMDMSFKYQDKVAMKGNYPDHLSKLKVHLLEEKFKWSQ